MKLDLRNCTVVMSPDEPAYVHQAVGDLRDYVSGHTGVRPPLIAPGDPFGDRSPVILAGKAAGDSVPMSAPWLPANLGDQGLVLKTVGTDCIIAAGEEPHGSAFAIIELVKAIEFGGGQAWLEAPVDRVEKPWLKVRGIYAHQHWAYNYPWALRSWKFEDWRRYVDLLAYMRVNFLQIWSMCGICPVPLSKGDREYLDNYRRVIEYAKERRGMEVWIGECANNVAEDDKGQKVQDRDYFGVEVLKNPADPKQFHDIMRNRRQLYRIANNADGYWIIDSDPGKWPGSPTSEFVDILVGNRRLIDKLTVKGTSAKLAYWIWMSWGTRDKDRNRADAVDGVAERVHEPWELLPCNGGHLELVESRGFLGKSIYFPYGRAEDEPSPPTTRIRFDEMAHAFGEAKERPELRGMMANAQTPFAQLPNLFYFTDTAWHGLQHPEPDIPKTLECLARSLFRDCWREVADGWLMLHQGSEAEADEMAGRLEEMLRSGTVGEPAAGGRFVFPRHTVIVEGLVCQLRVRAWSRRLADELAARKSFARVAPTLERYLAAVLDWQKVHGFKRYLHYGPSIWAIQEAWKSYLADVKPSRGERDAIIGSLEASGYDRFWAKHLVDTITAMSDE